MSKTDDRVDCSSAYDDCRDVELDDATTLISFPVSLYGFIPGHPLLLYLVTVHSDRPGAELEEQNSIWLIRRRRTDAQQRFAGEWES